MTRKQYDQDGDGPLVDRRNGVGMALRILLLALAQHMTRGRAE